MKYVILYIIVFASAYYPQENFWKQVDTLKNESIFSIASNSKGHIFTGSWLGKISFSRDNGETWSVNNTAAISNLIFCLFVNSQDHIFAGTVGGGLLRSTDDGDNWTYIGLSDYSVISIAADSKNILYAATSGKYNGLFKSSDNGDTWNECGNGLDNKNIQALAVNSKDQIFTGTFDGIFLSKDGGISWIQMNNGLSNTSIYSLGVNSDDCIFAGTFHDGEIFYSNDSGENWNNKGNSLNTSFVRSFAFYENRVFAGSHDGVFISDDNGETWNKISSGLVNNMVQSIAVGPNGNVYAGTWGSGAYRSVNPIASADKNTLPSQFELEQNYPNPFNPSTKIRYSVPKSAHIVLKIYDILGNEIAVLVNEEKLPGGYEIEFSAQTAGGKQINLSSGVYFYSLQSEEFSSTKKFIFLK